MTEYRRTVTLFGDRVTVTTYGPLGKATCECAGECRVSGWASRRAVKFQRRDDVEGAADQRAF
jgi:hypothetical protein